MNIDHRAEAEKHLDTAARHCNENPPDMRIAEVAAWIGQGYATLARDEDQAARTADLQEALHSLRRRFNDTRSLVASHIAKGLASRDKQRWQAARNLAQGLDEAHNNVDDLVDAQLSDDGWDTKTPWTFPAAPADRNTPWAPTPDITAEIPEPVRRVLAEYLAAALLSKGDAQGVGQTITFALKHAGADLTSDIEKRITALTLGPDPSDPPF
ncbi:hypothetical protein [Streptomyces chartreusis]|uniref:hypothetical protein n=1 Tax=Streptomyces chartreusis TaxID=1969 RepID=UPI00123D0685|nr:hypothetical protein [Streptomyces chartreusis]QEV66268.1 hypothetical protein CP983_06030 [Streptomyces chartreusis]GGW99117.1 hypothetical protein GCM10010321_11990 [Streptomyces chartreusis]